MLYLAIDQHRKQLTVNLRDENGDVLVQRQVSTRWDCAGKFLAELQQQAGDEGFAVILEVCGFNHWLLEMLHQYQCRQVVLVQPYERLAKKTDRRDANALGELLWVNRHRLLAGKSVQNARCVKPPSAEDAADRQLTGLRKRVAALRTRTLNRVQHLLLKHNLQQDCPTKGIQTLRARRWLKALDLPPIDRLEMDLCLQQWELHDEHLKQLDAKIAERQSKHDTATLIATMPGVSCFGSLLLASRMNDIERFPTADSLANYWGLTPGCRNSGDATRLGSITKQGSPLARFILGQVVLHVLRQDAWMRAWYNRIKRRRGSKIARVAVMRRLATVLWYMVRYRQPYRRGGPDMVRATRRAADACKETRPDRPSHNLGSGSTKGAAPPASPSPRPQAGVTAEATAKAKGARGTI